MTSRLTGPDRRALSGTSVVAVAVLYPDGMNVMDQTAPMTGDAIGISVGVGAGLKAAVHVPIRGSPPPSELASPRNVTYYPSKGYPTPRRQGPFTPGYLF